MRSRRFLSENDIDKAVQEYFSSIPRNGWLEKNQHKKLHSLNFLNYTSSKSKIKNIASS